MCRSGEIRAADEGDKILKKTYVFLTGKIKSPFSKGPSESIQVISYPILDPLYVHRLGAFRSFLYIKADRLALSEGFKTV